MHRHNKVIKLSKALHVFSDTSCSLQRHVVYLLVSFDFQIVETKQAFTSHGFIGEYERAPAVT